MTAQREPHHEHYGRPVYRCVECGDRYERVGNLAAVVRHEREAHGIGVAPGRESAFILGPDGEPALTT